MGCVASKQTVSVTPAFDHSGVLVRDGEDVGSGRGRVGSGAFGLDFDLKKVKRRADSGLSGGGSELDESGRASSNGCGSESVSFRLGNLQKYVEGEQVAAGWPAWLSAVAGEAIQGWVPLRAESFEKLEKLKGENFTFSTCLAKFWNQEKKVAVLKRNQEKKVAVLKRTLKLLEKNKTAFLFATHQFKFAAHQLTGIGQGTYSSVFRARDLESGRTVALKKVRFDNFEPESVRFMAREIMILRRLDHPNIIKLEGLITSRLSCSMYLVFEYMEHDISGLLSCPEVEFSESQIKCYMKQLLSGIEHCHSRGVMHRDIKGANLLVNNDGILKVADFGLANFCNLGRKQPLTSRVVTLWYRPPELLLGSTEYGTSVDLWSVGCVFGELLTGKPILQGRTEVEQLHKIFKLCGSPPDDYWKRSKLPHATLFKPQHPYESCLWDTFKDLTKSAVSLIETLLSVEPPKRGTASSALASEYFKTKPHACDPSCLPKYPPSKEIDAKHCEEAKRKKPSGRARGPETTKKSIRKQNATNKLPPEEKLPIQKQGVPKSNGSSLGTLKEGDIIMGLERPKPSVDLRGEASHIKNASQGDVPFSGPLQVSGSSGFAWAKRRVDDSSMKSRSKSSSRSLKFEPSGGLHKKNNMELKKQENYEATNGSRTNSTNGSRTNSKGRDTYESAKHAMQQHWSRMEQTDSFDASDGYHSQELSLALYLKEETAFKRINMVQDPMDKVEFSGPLLSQSHRVEELLEKHERQIRQAVRRSWFQRVRSNGN